VTPNAFTGPLLSLLLLGAGEPTGTACPDLPSALEAGWQGKPVCELLHVAADHRVLKCSFAPGVGHERHYHPPHWGYALSGGQMRITDASGTREAELATGSRFVSEGIGWHEVLNIGKTPVVYLIVEQIRPHAASTCSTYSG
jgi:hypothetical protein